MRSASIRHFVTFNVTNVSIITSDLDTVGCTGMGAIGSICNCIANFSAINSFPGFNGSSSEISLVTGRVSRGFVARLHGAPTCHGTRRALSLLAVASGMVCNGRATTAPSNEGSNSTFTPNTGPVRGHRRGNTLTSLGSITGLDCCSYHSNVSGAFSVIPSTLNHRRGREIAGLIAVLSNCFTGGTRRVGVGILGHRALVSTCGGPRTCPGLAVHISNCTIGFRGLSGRRRHRMVDHAFRRMVW